MKKKYIPVREVLIFLAMLAFLLNYLGNKKDRQEVHAKNGVQAEESSQRGEGEETEEQNPNRESAGEQAYGLIHVDDDGIPELAAGVNGYYTSLYTWKDGKLYALMEHWAYGAMGNA